MSLPSIITFLPFAISLWRINIFSLTIGNTETGDTILVTSSSLIFWLTFIPFKKTSSFSFKSIFMFFNISFIFSSSSNVTFSCIMFNVTQRNIAPVSMLINPNFSPTFLVMVPFPLPAGPSIATISDTFYSSLSGT